MREADLLQPDIIASALHVAAMFFPDESRTNSRVRQSVIEQSPALRERESHKLSGLAETIAAALHGRGVEEPAATLAAESGITSDVPGELLNLTGMAAGAPKAR